MATRNNILLDVAAIAVPLALVLGARVMLKPSPTTAHAGGAGPEPAGIVVPTAAGARITPEKQRAVDWINGMSGSSGMRSPMAHPVAAPLVVVHEPEPEQPVTSVNPLAGLKLTGILGNESGSLAAINGKVYKVGDVVKPGLTLGAIDVHSNTVTFKLADGTELKLVRQLDPLSK